MEIDPVSRLIGRHDERGHTQRVAPRARRHGALGQAQTRYTQFSIAVMRPVVGVMTNDIVVYSVPADNRFDMAYLDVPQHLPAPQRFSDIDSPSGLKIKACKPPSEYRIDCVGYDDTEVRWPCVAFPTP